MLNPGKYILAVSGGVDSVTLLDVSSNLKDVDLVVAHFDHGIRADSKKDRLFVEELAKKYNLPFEYANGNLGPNTSEDSARQARYKFLLDTAKKHNADAVITAHHQDDVIETMIMNIMRGTKRKGLSSLVSTQKIVRPMLGMSKQEILSYAKKHNLKWQEDETNSDEKYLRNWVRKNVLPKLSEPQRKKLIVIYEESQQNNQEIEDILSNLISEKELDKTLLQKLSHAEATELVAHWLRENGLREFNSKQIEKIVVNAKTLPIGKKSQIGKGFSIKFKQKTLELTKE